MADTKAASRAVSSDRLEYMEAIARDFRRAGLIHRVAEDDRFDGRSITLDRRSLINFGSCSYLGLETDARLKASACEAVLRYGVQFSSSRAYVSAPLYAEFEALVSRIVGGHPVVITPTTSLGHLAAIPLLVGPGDAVLYDSHVHNSVQAVLPTLREQGIPCESLAHNRLDQLELRVVELSKQYGRVLYLCDGVYSMQGDLVDSELLFRLLDENPALHAYVDDAHGVGWAGKHGAGTVIGRKTIHERMVVALGFAKGFGVSGAALVVPRVELADRLFSLGSTLIFSGPMQPAQLGAGIASARVLLSDELPALQAEVIERIDLFDTSAKKEGLPLRPCAQSPIRFIEVGREELAVQVGQALKAAGYFVNVASFPAVPRGHAGIRAMLTRQQTLDDIRGLVRELSKHLGQGRTRTKGAAYDILHA